MLEPAHTVISLCGGFAAVATVTQRSEVRVRRWCYPKDRGGTGGLIPAECQQVLLDWAQGNGVSLRADDFFRKNPQPQASKDAA